MSESEKQEYHRRAVAVYRGKLAEAKKKQTKPDGLSVVQSLWSSDIGLFPRP